MSCEELLSQLGLLLGFAATIFLSFSQKVGTIMQDGRVRYDGLDDLAPPEEKKKKVRNSHFTPTLHKFRVIFGLSSVLQGFENMQHLIFDGVIGAH